MTKSEPIERMRTSSLDVSPEELDQISTALSKLACEYFTNIADRRTFPETFANKTNTLINSDLSLAGESLENIIEECRTVIDLSRHNGHPRFFGYVASPSTPIGAFADLIASTVNANVTCWRSAPSGTDIEKLVVRWLGSLVGYNNDSHGLLTSGGSMANLIAILTATRCRAEASISTNGLWKSGAPLTLYVSDEVHMSVVKVADILGLGRNNVRSIKCDDRLRMDVQTLRASLVEDLSQGVQPFCVVASAGTVGTGAVDPLEEVANVAQEFGLWFHVDGAYGVPATLHPQKRDLFRGLDRADSLSLDPHKWLYVPVDAGCLLFRDEQSFRAAFSSHDAEYVKRHGYSNEEAFAFWDYGIELSRRARALKVWLTLRYYGLQRIAAAVADDMKLASYLGELITSADDFELLAPVELSICCFRYVPPGFQSHLSNSSSSEQERLNILLDELNARIMTVIQNGGRAYLSNASVRGRFALRACITNFRTTKADIDQTVSIIREAALECGDLSPL